MGARGDMARADDNRDGLVAIGVVVVLGAILVAAVIWWLQQADSLVDRAVAQDETPARSHRLPPEESAALEHHDVLVMLTMAASEQDLEDVQTALMDPKIAVVDEAVFVDRSAAYEAMGDLFLEIPELGYLKSVPPSWRITTSEPGSDEVREALGAVADLSAVFGVWVRVGDGEEWDSL